VTGGRIKFINEKLYDLLYFAECSANDQVNENVQGGVCCIYESEGKCMQGLGWKP